MNRKNQFAAGLVPWLIQRLAKEGIQVDVQDQRPEPLDEELMLTSLHSHLDFRPHQQEAIEAAVVAERGIVHHPTAAGKTCVLSEIVRRVGRPALVLVHRKDLLYQTERALREQLGTNSEVVGIIGDGQWVPRLITVATFQTLYQRVKEQDKAVERWLREEIGQVHVDEAHHLPAKSFGKVMSQLWSAYWRFGYSATPYKEDDPETTFRVMSWLGPTIHQVTASELAERGHLVKADVFMIQMPKSSLRYKTWQEAVEYGIVENVERNQRIVRLARSVPKPLVILVERLKHGENLAKALGTQFIAGDAPTATRQAAWEAIRQGTLDILVVSRVGDEGIDVPNIQTIILAGGGKAAHLTIQRVGRGLRTAEGKSRVFVFDMADTGKYLGAHAKARSKTYREQSAYTYSEIDFEEAIR